MHSSWDLARAAELGRRREDAGWKGEREGVEMRDGATAEGEGLGAPKP
jgi:hypothetical protein